MEHTEDIDEWEQIEKPHQPLEASGWNMVVINENYVEVGDKASSSDDDPPSPTHHHHELSLPQLVPTKTTDPEDGASSSVSGDGGVAAAPPSDWRVRVVNEWRKVLKLRLEGVRERVSDWAMRMGAFWSFTHVTGAAAAVLVALVCYAGVRRRRRRVVRWVHLLREKDEVSIEIIETRKCMSLRYLLYI
uniref:Uncharacterized protein n=1 Tax=Cajanus cajan TaxID=3821 RepID=A0A151R295_CAJCA|nr:hypothetical protein KK1_042218 [Cajanus cajan]